jgi:hypothetical protein
MEHYWPIPTEKAWCWISVPPEQSSLHFQLNSRQDSSQTDVVHLFGCLFQEDKVKSFKVAQPLRLLFLVLLLLKSNASGAFGKFCTGVLEPALFVSISLSRFNDTEFLLASVTTFVWELPRAVRRALANACALFVFTCSFGVPGVALPFLQKWQMYVILLTDPYLPALRFFFGLVTRMEQFIPGFNTDSHLQQNKKTIVKAPWLL